MDGIRVLSDIPKLRNLYFQNKKESNNGDEGKSDEKHDRLSGQVQNHPAYTTTLLRYRFDLAVLDGERIKLRESSQNAAFAAMAVPAEKLSEIPEQSRWLEGFSWGDGQKAPAMNETDLAGEEIEEAAKKKSRTADPPAPDMFDEVFIEKATAAESDRFTEAVEEANALDAEAEALLQSAANMAK